MIIKKYRILCVVLSTFILFSCSKEPSVTSVLPVESNGKVVLVNYWAEWCYPCREEIPELNLMNAENPGEVVVYGVNYDGITGDALAAVEQKLGVEFETLTVDPAQAFGLAPPTVLPVTLVIDRAGSLVSQLQGKQTLESLNEAVEPLLEGDQ